uniref:Fea2 n=1 Tax=Arundo donax TaxID=35708 RepID=A0A0A9G9Q9_ARUDO
MWLFDKSRTLRLSSASSSGRSAPESRFPPSCRYRSWKQPASPAGTGPNKRLFDKSSTCK